MTNCTVIYGHDDNNLNSISNRKCRDKCVCEMCASISVIEKTTRKHNVGAILSWLKK